MIVTSSTSLLLHMGCGRLYGDSSPSFLSGRESSSPVRGCLQGRMASCNSWSPATRDPSTSMATGSQLFEKLSQEQLSQEQLSQEQLSSRKLTLWLLATVHPRSSSYQVEQYGYRDNLWGLDICQKHSSKQTTGASSYRDLAYIACQKHSSKLMAYSSARRGAIG